MSSCSISFGFLIIITINGLVYGYQETQDAKQRLYGRECDTSYSVTCLKLDVVGFLEKLSEKKEYDILPGVSVVKEINASDPKTSEIVAEIARSFPNDAEKRLNGYLLAKLGNFLQSHSLRLKLMDKTAAEEARAVFTGREKGGFGGGGGKGGKKEGYEGIIAAAMMMKSTMFAIATGGIAMIAGKALMTGMMALMLSAIVGIKSLTSHGKSTTYEIIAKPVYASSHSHSVSHEDIHGHGGGHGHSGFGGYGRSINLALPEHLTKAKA